MSLHETYLNTLTPWLSKAAGEVFTCPDRPELSYYGDGTNSWGVQTNQKALSAFAIAATDPLFEEAAAGISREALLRKALACLRYSLATHLSGDYHLTNGPAERWGHTWISVLGVERMAFALHALEPYYTGEDRAALRRMFLSEADFLLTGYPVRAGLVENNRPESNMWNGALLLRCALEYPDAPNAALYEERGRLFILNSISVPSEEKEPWFVGANFFESMATNHHEYMNVGYMVITLSQLAYLHFTYKLHGKPAPDYLYKNARRLWDLVRECIFPDGRLLRIGGDSRIRYCYCQDYLNMVLALAADRFGENTARLEESWQRTVNREQAGNADGTFLSARLELFRERAPLYFARLEADRAASAAQGAFLHRTWPSLETAGTPSALEEPYQWHDPYHGGCFVRNRENFSSFVWIAAQKPQGLALPLSDSSLAEWDRNLVSCFDGDGLYNEHIVLEHQETMLSPGFVTSGRTLSRTWEMLDESKREEKNVELILAYAALPDGATTVTIQYARAVRHCHLLRVKGLHLNIPNDLFNGYHRDYAGDGGRWLCVDGRLGVASVYGDPLTLRPGDHRTIGLRNVYTYDRGMLQVDEVCTTLSEEPRWYEDGSCILDFAAVLRSGADPAETEALQKRCRRLETSPDLRAVSVPGRDGKDYLVVLNLTAQPVSFAPEGREPAELLPGQAAVL